MRTLPTAKKKIAVMISSVRRETALVSGASCMSCPRDCYVFVPAIAGLLSFLFRDETGFLHQQAVANFLVGHPAGELSPLHEGLVERTFVHELLPVSRRADFLHQVHVIRRLLGRHAWRHENASQHHILNVKAV